jgi:hypothetical protein
VLDEVHCLRTGTLGSYMGRRDLWLRALSWGTHLSLCAYYVSESAWWLLQTCPELDMALGPGGRWLRRWDGEGTWSGRLERWFNWPLVATCLFDLARCVRCWRLLGRAQREGRVSDAVVRCERWEIVMDFLGCVVGEMFLNLFGLRNPNRVASDFVIYLGSLLCPLCNEYGFVRAWLARRRQRVYDEERAQRKDGPHLGIAG